MKFVLIALGVFLALGLIDRIFRSRTRSLRDSGLLPPPGAGTDADVDRLLTAGRKIDAIKLHREIPRDGPEGGQGSGGDPGQAASKRAAEPAMNPTLLILALSTAAALTSALGVLPLVGRHRMPTRWIGWGNAIAAGMMLGAAYMLSALEAEPMSAIGTPGLTEAVGALLGIVFIYWTHVAVGTEGVELNRARAEDPVHGYRLLMVNGLHSASEGMAMAVAMVIDLEFGVLVALALAIHNIPEATVLASALRGRGLNLGEITGLAVATNVSQVLLAVATYSIVTAAPATLPWILGFAIGALVQLVLVELLPESYREAGQASIALVTVVALGVVVLIQGLAG